MKTFLMKTNPLVSLSYLPLLALLLMLVGCDNANSQSAGPQYVSFQTNAVCQACEKTIEGALNNNKGVTQADLDLADKVVTIAYDPAKVDSAQLQKIIEAAGYEAKQVAVPTREGK
jgi:copper chaperone CopZ